MYVCIYVWIYIIYIYIRYSTAFSHYCFRQSNAKWMSERMSDSKMIEIWMKLECRFLLFYIAIIVFLLFVFASLFLFFSHVTPTHARTHTYIMHAYIYMHTYIHIAIRQYTQHDRQWDIFRWLYSRLWNI